MSLDNKVVNLADLKVSHDYLLEQDELLSDKIDGLGSGIDDVESTIGNLSNLSTTQKDNIVSAINEVLQTGGKVKSVNSKTGDVVLKTSDLTNDSGYLTNYTETDPTVPSWAKQASKPTYTAQEVGASSIEDMNSEVNTRRAADAQLQSQITALGNGAPIPVETVAEMIDNTKAYLYTGAEAGWLTGYWYTYDSAQAKFIPRGEYGVGTVIDNTLTVPGDAADAKATGDAISEVNGRLREQSPSALTGFSFNGWKSTIRFPNAYNTQWKYFESSNIYLEPGLVLCVKEVPDGRVVYRIGSTNVDLPVGYCRFDIESVAVLRVYSESGEITPSDYVDVYYDSLQYGLSFAGDIPAEIIKHFYLNNGIAYGPTRMSVAPIKYKANDRITAVDYDMLIGSTWVTAGHTYLFAEDTATPIVLRYSANTSKDISEDDFTGKIVLIRDTGEGVSDSEKLAITGGYVQTEYGNAVKTNVSVGTFVDVDTYTAVENYGSIIVRGVIPGMMFRVFGSGSANYLLWAWLDSNQKLLSKSGTWKSSGETGLDLTAPDNAALLVCSSVNNYQYGFSVDYLGAVNNIVSEIDEIKKQINTGIKKSNFSVNKNAEFAFFSDVHGNSVNVQHIVDYAVNNGLNAVLNGGDTCLRYLNDSGNSFDWYANIVGNAGVDILSAVGNHDLWDGALWTKAAGTVVYNNIIAPIAAKSNIEQPSGAAANGLCYYYKDYNNVRVVFINALTGHASVEFWDTAQADWLSTVLSDAATNNKHVIIVNHSPFPKAIAQRDAQSAWNSWIDYRSWTGSDSIVFDASALDVIKSFVTGGGKLVCLLTGHTHVDNLLTATGYDGIKMVSIASARYNYHTDGVISSSKSNPIYDCFNHIVVDTDNCLFKVARIGWNTDASMKVRDYLTYRYDTDTILVS